MSTLDRDAAKFALDRVIQELDYDLWKEITGGDGEEDSLDDYVDIFVEAYEEDQDERGVTGATEAQQNVMQQIIEDEGPDIVFSKPDANGKIMYEFFGDPDRAGDRYFISPDGDIES